MLLCTGWAFGCTDLYRNTPVMREAAVWCKVVGGSETVEAPNWYDYALRVRRELCVHDGALRVGVFDASESYGHARRARRVGYIAVIGSEGRRSSVGLPVTLRRNSTKFGHRSWVDLGSRSRSDLGSRFDLGSISLRSRFDLFAISVGSRISSRSRVDLG